jgi:hypothetical protein
MRNNLFIIPLLIFTSCVGPEEPLDGLYKNSPVVVNTNESFTFSLRGQNYTTEENYTLTFPTTSPIELTTVLVVTDFAGRTTDTSYFNILNSNDSLLAHYELTNNINVAPVEDIEINAIPQKIFFKADDFSGVVQLVLAIGD